jgi:hypothetical protein
VQYGDVEPQQLLYNHQWNLVTLCCQTTATTSMHSVCMMYTLMLEELLAVATAALSRGHTITLCSIATFSLNSSLHHQCNLVTLCCQTTATTSMHSVCMMYTLMLEELSAVATAALSRGHTITLCSIATFSLNCCLQPPVRPCAVKLQQLQACIASV